MTDAAQLDDDAAFDDEFKAESELAASASSTEHGAVALPPPDADPDPEVTTESRDSVDSDVELAANDEFEQEFADEFDDEFADEFGVNASPHIMVRCPVAFNFLNHTPSMFLPHSSKPNIPC